MIVPQERLLYILLGSIFVGVLLGVVYDFFRIRRISYSSGAKNDRSINKIRDRIECFIIFFEDVLYAVICSVVLSIFIFYMNSGRLRGIAIIGSLLGFWLYYNTVGKLVVFCSERIIRFIRYILRKIYSIFLRPLLLILVISVKITLGRLFLLIYTLVRMRKDIKKAEKGLELLNKKYKGRSNNEKKFKHIRESGGSRVHSVLHGNYSKDAV